MRLPALSVRLSDGTYGTRSEGWYSTRPRGTLPLLPPEASLDIPSSSLRELYPVALLLSSCWWARWPSTAASCSVPCSILCVLSRCRGRQLRLPAPIVGARAAEGDGEGLGGKPGCGAADAAAAPVATSLPEAALATATRRSRCSAMPCTPSPMPSSSADCTRENTTRTVLRELADVLAV